MSIIHNYEQPVNPPAAPVQKKQTRHKNQKTDKPSLEELRCRVPAWKLAGWVKSNERRVVFWKPSRRTPGTRFLSSGYVVDDFPEERMLWVRLKNNYFAYVPVPYDTVRQFMDPIDDKAV